MFYSLFLLCMGIFIGQEYTVPSVKDYTYATLYYLNTKYLEHTQEQLETEKDNHPHEPITSLPPNDSYFNMLYTYLCKFNIFNSNIDKC